MDRGALLAAGPSRRRHGHDPLTGMQKDRGTTNPAPPSMQKRNTGIANAGCVWLLRAPREGNGIPQTPPSRFGIASPSVQFQLWQQSLLLRARVLDFDTGGTTPTAHPL